MILASPFELLDELLEDDRLGLDEDISKFYLSLLYSKDYNNKKQERCTPVSVQVTGD